MKATLISWTADPVRTTLTVWDASKGEEPMGEIIARNALEPDLALFERILKQEIPVGQFATFDFVLEDVPVSWREQAVRHRVGVSYGPNYGVDMFPSEGVSFWSQSMRIQSMEHFASDERYYIPESIVSCDAAAPDWYGVNKSALEIYSSAMEDIETAYAALVQMGIPMEDARNLIPLGATHRIAMTVNLQALRHIVGERGCWILQASLWAPVISSMVDELCAKVHPLFRKLVQPPCVKDGEYTTCAYHEENIRRWHKDDSLTPCPLWLHETGRVVEMTPADVQRLKTYERLWDHELNGWEW